MSHGTQWQSCCDDAVVNALTSLLRLTNEYKTETLTVGTITRHLDLAKTFAQTESHIVDSVNEDLIVNRATMLFTVHQPEGARLVGDEAGHVPWLPERRAEIFQPGSHWHNYRNLLETRIAPHPLNRLDEITDTVLGDLEDPRRPGQWDRRGLVMGQVQSGKTANYIGLICKAADAGYKLIVVLAGSHNNLRAQTQFRVDEGFTGRDTREGASSIRRVGVGLATPKPVISLTSATDDGDFRAMTAQQLAYDFGKVSDPTVFVVKKNATVLRNLQDWLRSNAPTPQGHQRIADTPILVIDDEADNASIDTADHDRDLETNPTTINRLIRQLLNMFDQSAFVGYTATPFANIFINNEPADSDYGEDLFPRSFIYAIPAPSNYVGPEQMFDILESDDLMEAPRSPLMVDTTDTDEWLPGNHKAHSEIPAELFPASLERAIDSFVLACAARRVRGQASHHMSMLVHVTRFVKPQQQVRDQVADYLLSLRNEIQYGGGSKTAVGQRLKTIWEDDFVPGSHKVPPSSDEGHRVHGYDEVERELARAVGSIEIRMINGSSADALDYHKYDAEGLKTIVIGGAKLSRGLTLEGLTVSYYLRATRMYDTLMQMGRWFGYRPGYQDLCRIYTTPEIHNWYRNIAIATRELLDEFAEMEAEGATPKQFGLKVRHSPGMLVTSAAKMRNGRRMRVAFGDTRPEVTTFDTRRGPRTQGLGELTNLIVNLNEKYRRDSGDSYFAWHSVSADLVTGYFGRLASADLYRNSKGVPRYLADYIEERVQNGALVDWTVLLKSVANTEHREFIGGLSVGLATRSHRGSAATDSYIIKSLIGSQDERFDLDSYARERAEERAAERGVSAHGRDYRHVREQTNGLLILYVLRGTDIPDGEHLPDGPPYSAYSVSFPNDPSNTSIEYVVNNVYDSG